MGHRKPPVCRKWPLSLHGKVACRLNNLGRNGSEAEWSAERVCRALLRAYLQEGETLNRFGMHAKIRSQAGQRDALVAVLLAEAALQQVPGCQLYFVSVSASEPDTIWVTEVWSSQAEQQASLVGDDIQP